MIFDKSAQSETKRVSITVVSNNNDLNKNDQEHVLGAENAVLNKQTLVQNERKENYTPRFSVRMVILGDSDVGKTTMMSALIKDFRNNYRQRTIGADFFRHVVPTLSIDIKIIEISGHRAFHEKLCPSVFSKHPDVVCLVYSIGNAETLNSLATYWAKILEKNSIGEGCRVQLIGCALEGSFKQNEKWSNQAKTTASNVAKMLRKKQVDMKEINASDSLVVTKLFEEVAEQAASRILHQLIKQLQNSAAGLVHTKLILRKSGFSESFVSRHRLEPLCTLVKDQTNNSDFAVEDFQPSDLEDEDSCLKYSSRWIELHGSEILIFPSVKHARNGDHPLRKIMLNSQCKTHVLNGAILAIDDGICLNVFIPNSSEVAEHWRNAIQDLIAGMTNQIKTV